MEMHRFNFKMRIRSLRCAWKGIVTMLKTQHNAWIHALATVLVLAAGLFFGISAAEWAWVVIAAMSVWTAEALNTAFEFLCDVASPDFHPLVEKSKDVAAGAVLISVFGAVIIGLIVFLPKVLAFFMQGS